MCNGTNRSSMTVCVDFWLLRARARTLSDTPSQFEGSTRPQRDCITAGGARTAEDGPGWLNQKPQGRRIRASKSTSTGTLL